MDLINCSICGKMILKNQHGMCPECSESEFKLFSKVREYVYEHPQAKIPEVSSATGVPYEKLFQYVREGRLMIK